MLQLLSIIVSLYRCSDKQEIAATAVYDCLVIHMHGFWLEIKSSISAELMVIEVFKASLEEGSSALQPCTCIDHTYHTDTQSNSHQQ
jgi:hypothetical protein